MENLIEVENRLIASLAQRAAESAVYGRRYLAKAKQQKIQLLALSDDRMAQFYEGQCMRLAELLMKMLENQQAREKFIKSSVKE